MEALDVLLQLAHFLLEFVCAQVQLTVQFSELVGEGVVETLFHGLQADGVFVVLAVDLLETLAEEGLDEGDFLATVEGGTEGGAVGFGHHV